MFTHILLANCLVILGFNLLMLLPELKVYLLDSNRRIITGLSLYTFQFIMTKALLKENVFWLTDPFKLKAVWRGIIAFVIVLLLSLGLVTMLDKNSFISIDQGDWINFSGVFLLNSLPGAAMEEWLFRYFPVRFVHSASFWIPANAILIFMLLLFTLIHIPAFVFQYNTDLSSLGNIFVTGIFLFLIYFTTRNVLFTALFHAFCNNPKFLMDSVFNWQYFYASVFAVTLAWPFIADKIAHRAASKKEHYIQE